MNRISRCGLEEGVWPKEGVQIGNHRISSLLFALDVGPLVSSSQVLQHVRGQFAAECEVVLPLGEQFKYLGILFMKEGKMEPEIGFHRWCCLSNRPLC